MSKRADYPPVDDIARVLAYREDGELIWRGKQSATSPVKIGEVAGGVWGTKKKYKSVRLLGKRIMVHVIVWALHNGRWPTHDVDHIDGDELNNRIENLREATRSQNSMNRKGRSDNLSGLKGARRRTNRDGSFVWTSSIHIDGKSKYLGRFSTPEEAHAAYVAAAEQNFGEFARAA